MKFEIQQRTFQQLQRDTHDALVVIWSQGTAARQDLISDWVNKALKAGDFEHKTGSILQSYGMDGVKARRVLVVSCGEGKTADHKAAVSAAWASLKGAKVQRLGLHWAGDVQPEQVQHAVVTLAEASYTYTTTLSKAKPRALTQVSLSAESVTAAHRHALDKGHASVAGIETAKEGPTVRPTMPRPAIWQRLRAP